MLNTFSGWPQESICFKNQILKILHGPDQIQCRSQQNMADIDENLHIFKNNNDIKLA